jgi:hypothetical protein
MSKLRRDPKTNATPATSATFRTNPTDAGNKTSIPQDLYVLNFASLIYCMTVRPRCRERPPMKPNRNYPGTRRPLDMQVIYGFDRVTFWLEITELPISKATLEKHCGEVKVTLMQMPYNAKWKLEIEVFQPTLRCLQLLENALGHGVAVLVTYVEVAFDLPSASAKQARARRNSFLASAKMLYERNPVRLSKHGTTFYFGPRFRWNGKKWVRRNCVLVIYADRPSKLLNARPSYEELPCTHTECRVSGSDAIAEIGIVSLADLIAFDHVAFWEKSIRLYELPERKILGYRLAEAKGKSRNVTDAAFRKRAAKWLKSVSIPDDFGSNFIMHNAMRKDPEICKYFKQLSFAEWLDEVTWL